MRGVIFDLDGTLTDCQIDYAAIRRELGLGPAPILEQVDTADPQVRAVLDRHETAAAEASVLAAGARELLGRLAVPAAIVTRNSRPAADATLARHDLTHHFAAVVTREELPHKPHPHPVRHAAAKLGTTADACLMVGDGRHDVEAGLAAGATTVWLALGRARNFPAVPDHIADDLPALLDLWLTTPGLRCLLS